MIATIQFDPADHRYTVNGKDVVSVTQALTDAGLIDPRWFTEEAAIRGTYVHQAIALDHEGDLDDATLDPVLAPYIAAYRKFRTESGFIERAWEEKVCDADLAAAGMLDLWGHLPRPVATPPHIDLIDIKTGSVPSWVGYQTAAYARMLPLSLSPVRWRWCLQLCPDGSYRLHPLTKTTDIRVFMAALTVAQAKRGWL